MCRWFADDPNSILKRPHRSHIPKPTATHQMHTSSIPVAQNKNSPAKRGPFLRPHPPPNPPSGRASMHANSYASRQMQILQVKQQQTQQLLQQQRLEQQQQQAAAAAAAEAEQAEAEAKNELSQERSKTATAAVYDTNGVRLDHTPTDDEINWLWDKVRTCLDRDGSRPAVASEQVVAPASVSSQTSQTSNHVQRANQANSNNIQSQAMNTRYMDGASITSQLRTASARSTSSAPNITGSSGYGQAHVSVPRAASGPTKKVSMDALGAYNRRQASLLSQRKREQGSISYHNSNFKNDATGVVLQTSVHHLNGAAAQQGVLDQKQVPDASNLTSTGPGIYPPANGKLEYSFKVKYMQ